MPEQNLTGYPSIDKPWLKYYSEKAINAPLPKCTIYEYLWENNKDHLDDVALNYFGNKITYGKLFESIEKAAKGFMSIGIKPGDIVPIICIATPEIIFSFYALNRIGAVSNWLDLRMPTEKLLNEIKTCNSPICLLFEKADPLLCSKISLLGIKCIYISISDSLQFPKNLFYKTKKINTLENMIISWNEFLENANTSIIACDGQGKDSLAILEHTGGTTGTSKAVMLTNQNVNSVVEQYRMGSTPLSRQDRWLSIGFPFIAYSLICSIHLPLSLGITGVLCFDIDVKKIKKIVQKHRCNHMSNTPTTWEQLASDSKKTNYSFLKNPVVGADTLHTSKEIEINAFLKHHGAKCEIVKGYGMTEVSSAVSVCAPPYNKTGSVGIPFLHTVISAFDPDTGDELPYNKQGEICICGPSVMLGYYNCQAETDSVLKCHNDGNIWMHSGNLGHVDADGFIFIDGRIKRMIIDRNGFKIFAPQIEQVLSECSCVDKCCVVGMPDINYEGRQIAIAFVVVKQGVIDAVNTMQKFCKKLLPEYSIPRRYVIVDKLPYTSAGKVDYRALEKQAEELGKK